MSDAPQNFDDPALKAALQRAFSAERAGEALRQRILAAVGEDSTAAAPTPIRVTFWQRPVFRIAAALLLALISLYAILATRGGSDKLPDGLLAAMVERHDECNAAPAHRAPGIPQNDFHLTGQALAGQLHMQVLSADLGGAWSFNGAALCPIHGQPSAHLIFASRSGHMSLFSIPPAGAAGARDSTTITVSHAVSHERNYGIASFVQQGVVYALVNDGGPSGKLLGDAELQEMLRKHKGDLSAAAIALGIIPWDARLR
jgi:hypothetical protein